MIHNLTHICVIELNIQYLPMWFYLEKRRKCLFIDHQLTHESYNGLNVNNLPIYIYVLHFLLGKPLYWWPDFANHWNDSMHGGFMLQNYIWCSSFETFALNSEVLENVKEYIWFWTDKIKHTCYIEIIQDQYAITQCIIDNFIYRFNRLLCALGKGWGLWQILYYISWNWWDKIFF